MVGMLRSISRERLLSLANSARTAGELSSKLDYLRQLRRVLPHENPTLLSELLPRLFDLQTDRFAPVRKFATEIIGEVGVKHLEFLPELVPVLMNVLDDGEPPVARQAIICGMDFFRCTLVEVAIQGLHTSELNDSLQSSWASMLELKDRIYSIAFQPGSGGVRLLALKFVEAVILLYTPDPNGSSEPPHDGKLLEFNISWIRKGHPVLNAGDLSIEASQKLVLLLDLLRFPAVKSISKLVIIVLVNSLSSIAKKRPAYFGRVLPVLLGLEPSSSATEGVHASGACHVLRNAFLSCLKCTHPGAAPWKDRLSDALAELKDGKTAYNSLNQVHNINESGEVEKSSLLIKEEKPSLKVSHVTDNNVGRKRSGAQYSGDLVDYDFSGKRVKSTSSGSEESSKELDRNIDLSREGSRSVELSNNKGVVDTGPVLQLVAMFGALVAQGEKAVPSLEILISSISADLLAEVVMANMRNLPLNHPHSELDDELLLNTNIVGSETQAKYPSSFLAGVLSLSSSFPPIASLLSGQQSVSNDIVEPPDDEDIGVAALADHTDGAETTYGTQNEVLPISISVSSDALSGMEGVFPIPRDTNDIGNLESEIPGLDSSAHDEGLSETLVASSLASTDLEYTSQEQVTCSGGRSPMEILPSISTDRSEEHSPKAAILDSNSLVSSTATSVGLSSHFVLPKMSAPVVNLDDEQKDHLQILAFTRIVEAYKQIAVAGGSQLRFSLLAYLGVEFPLELNPWKLLQEHIFSDYLSHEGHELTLRVLYRLYREAEEETDFFSSTTATSVYEMFLLAVSETLRDSFPPTDKSLSRLLNEAPYLPKSILKLLESLCCPGNCETPEKDLQGGDRVTQGLSTIWGLILVRPPIRDVCLKIALQSAVHHLEEVRMKAIRLVANKLYPMSSIFQQIEDFANEMVISMINDDAMEKMDAESSITESRKESDFENPSNEHHSVSAIHKDVSSRTHQSCTIQSESSLSMPEAQRCMSLYFALCTKKHSLFRLIFVNYERASTAVKQAVQRQIPIVVRTIGSSSMLLEIISDPPSGSENLLTQVLHILTDGIIPSPELICTIRKLFDSKLKDVEILIPILPFLPRDEVLLLFPHFVNLSLEKFQSALARILQGTPHSGPVLDPAEVLIAIHAIDPERDGIPLKKVTDACNACFEQRQTFTQQVIAKVLNQLVEQIPLPLLFMRTVLQAIGAFPALVDFIMEILSRLVNKQIWKYPKLWVGFLKCAQLTKPQSFGVLLQLPPPQLENALNRVAALKAPLVAHASEPNVRSSLPRSKLVVLGLASDPQSSSQMLTSEADTGDDAGNSDKEAAVEKTRESSAS